MPDLITTTLNGNPITGATLTAGTIGNTLAVTLAPGVVVDSIKYWDVTGPKVAKLADTNWTTKSPHKLAFNAPAKAGVLRIKIEPMYKGKAIQTPLPYYEVQVVASAPPVVVPTPKPQPDNGGNVPDGTGTRSMAWMGVCTNSSVSTAAKITIARALGIRINRFFASGADDNGNFGGWSIDTVLAYQKLYTDQTTIGMYGRQEQDAKQGRTAKPLTPEQQRNYWQQVAAKCKAAGVDLKRHWVELQNEYNANQYVNFGTSADNVTAERIDYVMREAQYAREALGPDATIIGPSVGYLANASKIVAWHKALVSAGILDLIDWFNDHIYTSNPDTLKAWLDGTRAIIGDKPWISTECQLRYLTLDKWPKQGPSLVKMIADAKVLPCYFLFQPKGEAEFDAVALTDGNGKLNQTAVDTWSMPVAA